MTHPQPTRRDFLATTGAVGISVGFWSHSTVSLAQETRSPNERLRAGCIGNGGMGRGDANAVKRYADIVANCDVDRTHAERLKKDIAEGKSEIYEDHRALLDRNDIDVVTISTPDHWHTQIAIDALRAGKDIYCQKPLTLTIAEGKLLRKVLAETKRTFQVGTQQRSDGKFQNAVGLGHAGRIGEIKRVTVAIGGAPGGGPFNVAEVPAHLNWDRWLGQAPKVEYRPQRGHGNFRWWYEYSGGKMTDWGAHHVDIAQWAIGMQESGPTKIEVLAAKHPVEFKNGWPQADDRYNTATSFNVRCVFPNGVEMFIRDRADDLGFDNGVMFEGTEGRYFVNRGKLTGAAVDALKDNPLPEDVMTKIRKGKPAEGHMANFIRCVREGGTPISDVASHDRALQTCHLANIAMRLNRTLQWDPQTEQIVGDEEANQWQGREQRSGFEIG
jgi:predicted dehydrogenase